MLGAVDVWDCWRGWKLRKSAEAVKDIDVWVWEERLTSGCLAAEVVDKMVLVAYSTSPAVLVETQE